MQAPEVVLMNTPEVVLMPPGTTFQRPECPELATVTRTEGTTVIALCLDGRERPYPFDVAIPRAVLQRLGFEIGPTALVFSRRVYDGWELVLDDIGARRSVWFGARAQAPGWLDDARRAWGMNTQQCAGVDWSQAEEALPAIARAVGL
jgi:hypothetical protein